MQENLIICYDYILEAWRMIQKRKEEKRIMLSDKIGLRRDWMTNSNQDNTDTGSVSASASSPYI